MKMLVSVLDKNGKSNQCLPFEKFYDVKKFYRVYWREYKKGAKTAPELLLNYEDIALSYNFESRNLRIEYNGDILFDSECRFDKWIDNFNIDCDPAFDEDIPVFESKYADCISPETENVDIFPDGDIPEDLLGVSVYDMNAEDLLRLPRSVFDDISNDCGPEFDECPETIRKHLIECAVERGAYNAEKDD